MEKLVQGIHKFQSDIFRARHELFERLTTGQNPQALFITCSDSRVMPDLITQAEPGDLFVLRNAGNLIPPHGAGPGQRRGGDHRVRRQVAQDPRRHRLRPHPVRRHAGALAPGVARPTCRACGSGSATPRRPARSSRPVTSSRPRRPVEGHGRGERPGSAGEPADPPVRSPPLWPGAIKLHGWVYKLETGQVFAYDPASRKQFVTLNGTPPARRPPRRWSLGPQPIGPPRPRLTLDPDGHRMSSASFTRTPELACHTDPAPTCPADGAAGPRSRATCLRLWSYSWWPCRSASPLPAPAGCPRS